MTHAEDIKGALYEAGNALSGEDTGAVQALRTAMNALKGIGQVFPAAAELASRMDSTYIELKDIAQEVNGNLDNIDFDPSELDAVNARLDRIYDLQKKYRSDTIAGLIALQEELRQKLSAIENSDDALEELRAKCQQLKTDCQQLAGTLTRLRTRAARQIEKEMQERLIPLGMPNVRFAIKVEQTALGRNGLDEVQFLFSANTSAPL